MPAWGVQAVPVAAGVEGGGNVLALSWLAGAQLTVCSPTGKGSVVLLARREGRCRAGWLVSSMFQLVR